MGSLHKVDQLRQSLVRNFCWVIFTILNKLILKGKKIEENHVMQILFCYPKTSQYTYLYISNFNYIMYIKNHVLDRRSPLIYIVSDFFWGEDGSKFTKCQKSFILKFTYINFSNVYVKCSWLCTILCNIKKKDISHFQPGSCSNAMYNIASLNLLQHCILAFKAQA